MVVGDAGAGEFRLGGLVIGPIEVRLVGAGFFDGDGGLLDLVEVFPEAFVFLGGLGEEAGPLVLGEEGGGDGDGAGGVEDVDEGAGVVLGDLDGGVGGGGGGAADEDGDTLFAEAGLFGFLGDVDHFVEGGSDESGEADDIGVVFVEGGEDFVAGDHDAEVDDVEAVAGEDHADDVFADVVDVAFDGGHDDFSCGEHACGGFACCGVIEVGVGGLEFEGFGHDALLLFLLHERFEPGDRLLHDAGRLHDLGEEHFSGAEEVADDGHAVHEGAFDDGEGFDVFGEGFLGVFGDELVDAPQEGVFEAFLHGGFAPGKVFFQLLAALAFEFLGEIEESLGGSLVAVEEDVFDSEEEVLGNLVVNLEHAGVDDAHVHSGLAGVVEEGGVHGLTDLVVAAEGEGDVGDTAGDFRVGEVLLDPLRGVEEIEGVVVVLVDAGGDGEDVGVEDDVLWRETDVIDEGAVGAFADFDLVFVGGGLTVFVEGHDHGGGAELHDGPSVALEGLFAFLERDRVDDAFALQTLQASLEDFPLGGIDGDGDLRNVGFGLHEVEEAGHHLDAVDEAIIEADVDDRRAVVDLLAGHGEGVFEFAFLNQFSEPRGAGDVGTFPDHEEIFVVGVIVDLGAGEAEERLYGRGFAGFDVADGIGDFGDVVGGVSAATAGKIDESGTGEVAEVLVHVRGVQVEAGRGEGVRHPGVGIAGDVGAGDVGEFLDEGAHLVGAEGAVEADGEWLGVRDGVPECFGFLRGDHCFTAHADGGGDDDGEFESAFFEDVLHGNEGGLGIERVEDRFDHEDVDASFDEGEDLLFVGLVDLIEGDRAEAGVVGIDGGVIEADGHGADRAGDVAGDAGLVGDLVGDLAGQLCGLDVDLVGELAEELVLDDLLVEVRVFATGAFFAGVFDEEF